LRTDAVVMRPTDQAWVDRGNGVRTTYLVAAANGARNFVSGITEFDAKASLPLHWHNCEESVVVLAGEADFEIEADVYPMLPNDTTLVPEGVPHRFANRGEGLMRILWIYGSIAPTRTLASTRETFAVGSEAAHRSRPGGHPEC
jgi:putative monooxygenase